MAPRSRAAETAAINNLIFASQELGKRMSILEATMHSVETSLARIEAYIADAPRSERQQIEILLPLHCLVEVVNAMHEDMRSLQGVVRLGSREPAQSAQMPLDQRSAA